MDLVMQRVMDGIQAIPALVFLLLVAAIWQQGMLSVVVVLAVLFPGAALALTVLAVNVLGDSARDRLDPRLRGTL